MGSISHTYSIYIYVCSLVCTLNPTFVFKIKSSTSAYEAKFALVLKEAHILHALNVTGEALILLLHHLNLACHLIGVIQIHKAILGAHLAIWAAHVVMTTLINGVIDITCVHQVQLLKVIREWNQ